ncbi:MAG: pirin family protein [Thermoplasmatota archaeon]
MQRTVSRVVDAVRTLEGEGMEVRRAFPTQAVGRLDPFLLLDHMGPWDFAPGAAKGAPDHPHRGFETVSYIMEGSWEHKDSQGNHGRLEAGGVQWMTAGDGVVHSEMPSQEVLEQGGRLHGIQLWVNLPVADKRMAPRYQDLPPAAIPQVALPEGAGTVRVIAGAFAGRSAAIDTRTPITFLHAKLAPGGSVELPAPADHAAFLYVLTGDGALAETPLKEGQLAVLSEGDHATVQAGSDGFDLLLLTGRPLGEPVFQWGPFVMTDRREILEAIEDYQAGRMGSIPATFA